MENTPTEVIMPSAEAVPSVRRCAFCKELLDRYARTDARFCGDLCRKKAWRKERATEAQPSPLKPSQGHHE